MRLLFLSQRFVLPMDTGGKIRTGKILEQLSKAFEITLVSNVEHPKDTSFIDEATSLCHRFVPVAWQEIRRGSAAFYVRLARNTFSSFPITALNDYSPALREAVEEELTSTRYDLAICDFVQSALMFQNVTNVPTVLFQHNVESEIARRHLEQSRTPVAKLFWALQHRRMTRFEGHACRQFDTVIAVSQRDAKQMQSLYGLDNVETIPTGVDTDYYSPAPDSDAVSGRLVFCGSMDWLPNQDAVEFFLTEVLPLVRRSVPAVSLTIVGRNPPTSLTRTASGTAGVRYTGWVEDTRPHIAKGQVFIVPIRIGGGTRMKIYEGMAMGRAVVSTTVGAEGLKYNSGTDILIADGAQALATEIVSLLTDDARRRSIASAGRHHVEHSFSWARVTEVFADICQRTAVNKVS